MTEVTAPPVSVPAGPEPGIPGISGAELAAMLAGSRRFLTAHDADPAGRARAAAVTGPLWAAITAAGSGLPEGLSVLAGQVLALNRERAWLYRDEWNRALPVPDAELAVDRPWERIEFERSAPPSLLRAEFGVVASARPICRPRATGAGPGRASPSVTTTPVSWDSEFFSLPPVHAGLRPVQAGGPPVWVGGVSEAAMRRDGRAAVGWLAVERLPDDIAGKLWSIARGAAEDAGRDPDALKKAMRINLEPNTSVASLTDKLTRLASSGMDEAFVDAFAAFPSLDQTLAFASQLIARTGRL